MINKDNPYIWYSARSGYIVELHEKFYHELAKWLAKCVEGVIYLGRLK